jgi:hypothetical protein
MIYDVQSKKRVYFDQILQVKGNRELLIFLAGITRYSKDYPDMGAKPPKWQNVKMTM